MQELRDQERVLAQWEKSYLEPPADEEPEIECCMCNRPAEYNVMGDYFCEECLHSEFRI